MAAFYEDDHQNTPDAETAPEPETESTPDPVAEPEPAPELNPLVQVYISSKGRETITKTEGDKTKKYVYGDINGVRFDVETDRAVFVTPEIASVLNAQVLG